MSDARVVSGGVLVRFVTHPHSVRTVRQLLADTLRDWHLPALVDDASLVVTELCTNALLHSGTSYFSVSVTAAGQDGVRIAVGDEGEVPAAAVVRRHGALRAASAGGLRNEATTGRGLAIVDELSDAWGVTVDGGSKWVWARLSTTGTDGADADLPEPPSAPTAGVARYDGPLPPGWHLVRLEGCPVQLGLAQDDHLDELVRELQLVAPAVRQPELASLIRGLLEGQAAARHMGRRTAQDAAAAGLEHAAVEMLLPERAAEEVQRLHDAVTAADAICDREQLLTLASNPDIRRLRCWMRDEIAEQIVLGRPPRAYEDWLQMTARADGRDAAT